MTSRKPWLRQLLGEMLLDMEAYQRHIVMAFVAVLYTQVRSELDVREGGSRDEERGCFMRSYIPSWHLVA